MLANCYRQDISRLGKRKRAHSLPALRDTIPSISSFEADIPLEASPINPGPKRARLTEGNLDEPLPSNPEASIPLASPGTPKRARLTEGNLEIHLRSMGRSRKTPSNRTSTTISTTDETAFGRRLKRNGVDWEDQDWGEAQNSDYIRTEINKPRTSLEPDESQFDQFRKTLTHSGNELTVQTLLWPILTGHQADTETDDYWPDFNLAWTEVENEITENLTDAKPDIAESFDIDQFPAALLEELEALMKPTQYKCTMPRLCVEWRGPNVGLSLARKQAAYDGALMVFAAHELEKTMGKDESKLLNQIQAVTVATNGKEVYIFGHYAVQKEGSKRRYRMCDLQSLIISSVQRFQETCKVVRNTQDWARKKATSLRDELITYHENKAPPRGKPVWDTGEKRYYYEKENGAREWITENPPTVIDTVPTPPSTGVSKASGSKALKK